MGLQDKVCIITGGGSGIGLASAIMMAKQGAKVVLVGRTASKVEEAAKKIESSGGAAMSVGLDVADYDGVMKMAGDVLDAYGPLSRTAFPCSLTWLTTESTLASRASGRRMAST